MLIVHPLREPHGVPLGPLVVEEVQAAVVIQEPVDLGTSKVGEGLLGERVVDGNAFPSLTVFKGLERGERGGTGHKLVSEIVLVDQ
jgi:hypothetical protein